jgi:hypothetical protein
VDDYGLFLRELTERAADRNALKRYWTAGPGLAKWAGKPHAWTALYHHLLKYLPPGRAKRTAAEWFHLVKGYWPGHQKGSNKTGPG